MGKQKTADQLGRDYELAVAARDRQRAAYQRAVERAKRQLELLNRAEAKLARLYAWKQRATEVSP